MIFWRSRHHHELGNVPGGGWTRGDWEEEKAKGIARTCFLSFLPGKTFCPAPSSIVSPHDEVLLRREGANQICTKASLRPLQVRLVQHILALLRCRVLLKSTGTSAKRRRKY